MKLECTRGMFSFHWTADFYNSSWNHMVNLYTSQGRRQLGFDGFCKTHQFSEMGSGTHQFLKNWSQTPSFQHYCRVTNRIFSSIKMVPNSSSKIHWGPLASLIWVIFTEIKDFSFHYQMQNILLKGLYLFPDYIRNAYFLSKSLWRLKSLTIQKNANLISTSMSTQDFVRFWPLTPFIGAILIF